MRKFLLLIGFLLILSPILAQERDIINTIYIVKNMRTNEEWIFENKPILPEDRNNLNTTDDLCEIQIRTELEEPKLATEKDRKIRPNDIRNNLVYYKRETIGFYICDNLRVNRTTSNNSKSDINSNNKNLKKLKILIIVIPIIIIVFGILMLIALKKKRDYTQTMNRNLMGLNHD